MKIHIWYIKGSLGGKHVCASMYHITDKVSCLSQTWHQAYTATQCISFAPSQTDHPLIVYSILAKKTHMMLVRYISEKPRLHLLIKVYAFKLMV